MTRPLSAIPNTHPDPPDRLGITSHRIPKWLHLLPWTGRASLRARLLAAEHRTVQVAAEWDAARTALAWECADHNRTRSLLAAHLREVS